MRPGLSAQGALDWATLLNMRASIWGQGGRIIVIYGAGHKRWLDQLLESAPTFEVVSPVPYLAKAVSE